LVTELEKKEICIVVEIILLESGAATQSISITLEPFSTHHQYPFMKNKMTTVLAPFLAALSCCAQDVTPSIINSSGGSAEAGYYQFEWSVGEMSLVNQAQSSDGFYVLTNGLLQPYVNSPAYFDKQHVFGPDELHIFPNPANKYVEIDFSTKQQGKAWFKLFDVVGKRVYDKTFVSYGLDHIEIIALDKLPAGMYMLYIQLNPFVGSYIKKGVYKIVITH